jgi:beta-galactosidase
LFVAVKLRKKVLPQGVAAVADCFIINEADLRGEHVLVLKYTDPAGKSVFEKSYNVKVSGGEEFGELLVEGVELPAAQSPGHYLLTASLKQGGTEKASGFDNVFAVNLNDGPGFNGHVAVIEDDTIVRDFLRKTRNIAADTFRPDAGHLDVIIVGNHKFEALEANVRDDLMRRVEGGAKLIVLQNAHNFAEMLNRVLQNRPAIYQGGGIVRWNGSGRLFVGKSRYLEGLPQGEGMSWEYQCFYKTSPKGRSALVEGIRLHHWGTELVVALGNQGQKEILSALSGVRVAAGDVILSTLTLLPNLATDEASSVVAKKLFLNLLER